MYRLPKILKLNTIIPPAIAQTSVLSTFSPKHLYLLKEDTQPAYEPNLCSQLLLVCARFQNYIFESTNRDSDVEDRLQEHGNDIWSPIRYGNSNYLSNVSSFGSLSFNKTKTSIETKVTAMKLQGFNL